MTKSHRLLAVLLPAVALTACTTIFSDDFEADPVGAGPLASPAGPPMGDSVSTQTGPGNSVTVTDAAPLAGGKSLILQGPSSGGEPRVNLTATAHPDNGKPILTRFEGRLSAGAGARINMRTDGLHWALRIELADGIVSVNDEDVGTYVEGGTHVMVINMFPTGDFWRFAMSGDANVPENLGGSLPYPAEFPGGIFGATIELEAPGTETYRLDDITMNQQT